jgi:hypothetical protein
MKRASIPAALLADLDLFDVLVETARLAYNKCSWINR